jgi:hypothetical protein
MKQLIILMLCLHFYVSEALLPIGKEVLGVMLMNHLVFGVAILFVMV